MNFTREPIIETVITPREGCKLVVRNSKGNGQEDYFVDAVEVVSFGHSFFFRSQERPKSFLVPVSDYEILELKETRMVLKNVASDRSIKIGGGRESAPPPRREEQPQSQEPALADSRPAPAPEPRQNKRDKRRRGRRGRDRQDYHQQQESREQTADRPDLREMRDEYHPAPEESAEPLQEQAVPEAVEKAPSFISKLFPPPPTLIKDHLSRYKPAETDGEVSIKEETIFEESIFEHPTDQDDNEE